MGRKVGVAIGAAVLLLAPLGWIALPPTEGAASDGPAGTDVGPTATFPPVWPSSWNLLGTDTDVVMSSKVVDLVELRAFSAVWDEYIYVRIVTGPRPLREMGGPLLPTHSWWLYLDISGDGNNDWIVEERPSGICSLGWDGTNADWGIGPACDVFDTLVDTDVGSAVRAVACYTGMECVDFALERSDYPGLSGAVDLILTAAAHRAEDLDLSGDPSRNPRNGPVGCNPAYLDDCTPPARMFIAIPEFPSFLAMAAIVPAVLVVLRRRAARRSLKSRDPQHV